MLVDTSARRLLLKLLSNTCSIYPHLPSSSRALPSTPPFVHKGALQHSMSLPALGPTTGLERSKLLVAQPCQAVTQKRTWGEAKRKHLN